MKSRTVSNHRQQNKISYLLKISQNDRGILGSYANYVKGRKDVGVSEKEFSQVDQFFRKVEHLVISKLVDQIVDYRSKIERARDAYNKKQEELRNQQERKQKEAILSKLIPQDEDSKSKGPPSPNRPSSAFKSKAGPLFVTRVDHIRQNMSIQKPLPRDPILRRSQSIAQQLSMHKSKSGSIGESTNVGLGDGQRDTVNGGADEGLFHKVQRHGDIFKMGSVIKLRKKMQRTIVKEGDPLDFDALKEDQRDKLARTLSDKYAPREQRKIYNICLNYKQQANNPEKKDYFYRRTKEYIFRDMEEIQQQIRVLESQIKPAPHLHRKSSSLSTLKMKSLLEEKAELARTLRQKTIQSVTPVKSQGMVKNFSEIFQQSSQSIPHLGPAEGKQTDYVSLHPKKTSFQIAYNLLG